MKIVNLKKPVTSGWLLKEGRRLDAGPFLSGAVEARILLESLNVEKHPLRSLTKGHNGGIYHAGRESRRWVDDPAYGIPFLSSSSVLDADLGSLPLISQRQIAQNPLFTIHKDWILVTRSGTIGRMVYAREDMDGMACSEHVMRVVPDPDKIPPGYLYAYLRSKFGVPLVVSGTYGAIIQHIEPEHIAQLPVPRLGPELEKKVHALIVESATLRSTAAVRRASAIAMVERELGWQECTTDRLCSYPQSGTIQRRLDAFYNSAGTSRGRTALAEHPSSVPLMELASAVYEPNRGARLKVDDPNIGVPFLSSSSVFRIEPEAEYLVSRSTNDFDRLVIQEDDLLLPRSGQVGGIIGRAVLPLQQSIGSLGSEHLVRVRMPDAEQAHIAFAIFASRPGYLATVGTAFGSSIPSLDTDLLSELRIPWFTGRLRGVLSSLVGEMVQNLSKALARDQEARRLVETSLEAPTSG